MIDSVHNTQSAFILQAKYQTSSRPTSTPDDERELNIQKDDSEPKIGQNELLLNYASVLLAFASTSLFSFRGTCFVAFVVAFMFDELGSPPLFAWWF